MQEIQTVVEPTFEVSIFIAGSVEAAKMICQKFCFSEGLCVTISPTDFIYTGGAESGVKVGLINYPRFPKPKAAICDTAHRLAKELIIGLSQWSATIVTPDHTTWFTRRDGDIKYNV